MTTKPSTKESADSAPYCGNCGHLLTGAVRSSACPECGRPLVEVLMRPSIGPVGRRYRSRARILGMPALDIALGPHGSETKGRARGFVAIGDDAAGVLAIGGTARGGVAIGGMAMGGFSMGGCSCGALNAVGGCAIGGTALGGFAMGILAQGGFAIGVGAQGGFTLGQYIRGGGGLGKNVVTGGAPHPFFDSTSFFFGSMSSGTAFFLPFMLYPLLHLVLGAALALLAFVVVSRSGLERGPLAGRPGAP